MNTPALDIKAYMRTVGQQARTASRLRFDLDSDASQDQLDKLITLTERYCVIYQTLRNPPPLSLTRSAQQKPG